MIEPRPIDRDDVILEPTIPEGTDKVVIVTYRDRSLLVSYDDYISGNYRLYFIKNFGFPPPADGRVTEKFSPNIQEIIDNA
jgi:hypothetical protein